MFGGLVLTAAKRVGSLQKIGESVLSSTKGVEGLQKCQESLMTTSNRGGGLYNFEAVDLTFGDSQKV